MDSLMIIGIVWMITIVAFIILYNRLEDSASRDRERMHVERAEWKVERQMLLDRIQAPSFAEYTAKVVREKKAEHPEEKPERVNFVS